MDSSMMLGIDILLRDRRELLQEKRIGLLVHAASVNGDGEHTIDRIARSGCGRIAALFGPEHGISTTAQDMEPVHSHVDPTSGVPVYSLYGATLDSLRPTQDMMDGVDVFVVDLQDIGSRYYTYMWTACLCAEACAEKGIPIVICDRPNPIGGTLVEGGALQEGFESFVGLFSLPVRHGMTIGEIVHAVNAVQAKKADLTILRMEGWQRSMSWPDINLPWINPSPNMRSYTAALLYPGMCLLEGTNMSEGRGTDTPFEIVGAPYIESEELIAEFHALGLPGVHLAPTAFIPVGQKWMGQLCQGVRWVIQDAESFRPYLTGLAFVWLIKKLYSDRGFQWRTAPYEFVTHRPAIDLLTGSAFFRDRIDSISMDDLRGMAEVPPDMVLAREHHLLYQGTFPGAKPRVS